MSIPPIGSGPSGSTLPMPSGSNIYTPRTVDSLTSFYSSDIANGQAINILDFSHQVLSSKNLSNEVIWSTQQSNMTLRNPLFNACVETSLAFVPVYLQALSLVQAYSGLYGQNQGNINSLNNRVDTHNNQLSSDQAAVNTLNAAITTYTTGNYPNEAARAAAFNILTTATNNYNNYANSRNSNISDMNSAINFFNSNTNNINQDITIVNNSLAAAGLASQPQQTLYSSSSQLLPIFTSPPFSTFSNPVHSLSSINNTMNQTASSQAAVLTSQLFEKILDFLLVSQGLTSKILKDQSDFLGFVQFFLHGQLPILPPAFTTPIPEPKLGVAEGGSTGSGVSLSSMIASLTSPLFERIVSTGIFASNVALTNLLSPATLAGLQYMQLQFLAQIGLLAGPAALNLLGSRLANLDLNSSGVSAAVALALISEITIAISSGLFSNGVKSLVESSFPQASPDLLAQLAIPAELLALSLGLLQLSQALNARSLLGQIFSNLQIAGQLGLSGSHLSTSEILKNSTTLDRSASNLARAGYTPSLAKEAVDKALKEASLKGDFDEQTYISSLEASGIATGDAQLNAEYTKQYLRSESLGRDILNQSLNAKTLLHNEIGQTILANEFVKGLIDKLNVPGATNRDLRDELVREFVERGASTEQAFNTANTLIPGFPSPSVSLEQASNELRQKSYDQVLSLGFSTSEANAFADQVVSTVIGPPIPGSPTSVFLMIEERLKTLVNLTDDKLLEQVKNNMLSFLAPTMELSLFAQRLHDPANSILLSALTGIIYSRKQPSNFLKNIDINI